MLKRADGVSFNRDVNEACHHTLQFTFFCAHGEGIDRLTFPGAIDLTTAKKAL